MAIDREGIIKAGESGVGEVADALVTRQHVGRRVRRPGRLDLRRPADSTRYDVAKAKDLAAAAGVDGQKIVIATSPISVASDVIAQATAAGGDGHRPDAADQDDLARPVHDAVQLGPAARKGIDVFMTAWYTSLADPMEMYGVLRTGEFSNYGSWSDASFDADTAQAIKLPLDRPGAAPPRWRTPSRSRIRAAAVAAALHAADEPVAGRQDHRRRAVDLLHVLPVGRHDRGQGLMTRPALSRGRRGAGGSCWPGAVPGRAARRRRSRGRRRSRPTVNALTEQLLDDAYVAARESEARYARGEDVRAARRGSRSLLKEEQAIAGRTLEEGSLLEKGRDRRGRRHPVVERVLEAGAVVHGRTTTPEFSCAPFTHSLLWGITRNPWDTDLSPGGSSGGSGAALAAGETLLATGSDIGGSIRIPASLCGVVGLQGTVRAGARACRRSTPTPTAPTARWAAASPTWRCCRTCWPVPTPHDQASLRPAYVLPDAVRRRPWAAGRAVPHARRLPGRARDRGQHPGRRRGAGVGRRDRRGGRAARGRASSSAATAWTHFGSIFGSVRRRGRRRVTPTS